MTTNQQLETQVDDLREENQALRQACGVPADVELRMRPDGALSWSVIDGGFGDGTVPPEAVVDHLCRRVVELQEHLKQTRRRRGDAVQLIEDQRESRQKLLQSIGKCLSRAKVIVEQNACHGEVGHPDLTQLGNWTLREVTYMVEDLEAMVAG